MNVVWERHPWWCGLVLGLLVGGLVGVLGDAAESSWPRWAGAGAGAGAITVAGVGVLGLRARALATQAGAGTGAPRLLGAHPWLTGLVVGVVAGTARAGAAVTVGEPLGEAAARAAWVLVPWAVGLGVLGRLAVRRPADNRAAQRDADAD